MFFHSAHKLANTRLPHPIKLWDHQAEAVERAWTLRDQALFFEMGTGKTAAAINIARVKFVKENRLLRTLVLGPPIVLENWRREFFMHSKLTDKDVTVLTGSGKKRAEALCLKALENEKRNYAQVFVTNYESLLMPDLYEAITAWHPEMIIYDEAHRCKNMTSKRTKAAIKLSDRAEYRVILTGTPVTNSPMDLFGQMRILDKGKTFGDNYWAFRAHFFYDKNAGMPKGKHFPDWRIRPGAMEEISQKLKGICMRVKKSECLDLPPLVRQIIPVDLAPEQAKLYGEMKKGFIAFINDKACVAELAITKALRLQQIVSGYVKMEDGSEIQLKTNPRKDALKQLLEDVTPAGKVLVWAVFKENYQQIREVCEELALKYVEVHGEVPTSKRQEYVDQFNNDTETRVFIGHPGSGGIGINLVSASYSIFYSRSFSLEHDLQAEARNHRGGSHIHEKITRIDIVAKDTIDEHICRALAQKEVVSEKVLRDISHAI